MSIHPVPPSFICHYGAKTSAMEPVDGVGQLHLALPHLGGAGSEFLHLPNACFRNERGFHLLESGDILLGYAMLETGSGIDRTAREIYSNLLNVLDGRHLYRIWNYVPRINSSEQGLERYRRFNLGRWQAFEGLYGDRLRSHLPAASAVGINGEALVVLFTAGRPAARHLENPEQVPAYHYPDSYGPKSPGFARASAVRCNHLDLAFISGTASIRGHASMHTGDVLGQLDVTLDNLGIMGRQLGTDLFDPAVGQEWQFKCYLRHPDTYPKVRELLGQRLGPVAEGFIYLQAEICRSELEIEIEASRIAAV